MRGLAVSGLAALLLAGGLAGCASEQVVRTGQTRDRAFELFDRGLAEEAAGRYAEAIGYFTEAIELNRRPAFYYKAGASYHQMGEPGRAVYFYDQALELAPDYDLAASRRELALLELKGEDFALRSETPSEPIEEIAQAPATPAPGLPSAESQFELARGGDRTRDAIFPELLGDAASSAADLETQARRAESEGRWADAARLWGQTARALPDSLEARLGHARALLRLGRSRSALDQYEAAARIAPGDPDVYIQWGNGLAEAGDLYMAEVRYRDCLEIDPANPKAYNNIGSAYIARGFPEEAVGYLDQSLVIDPTFAPAHLNRALALERTGAPSAEVAASLEAYLANGGDRRIEAEAWLIRLRREGES